VTPTDERRLLIRSPLRPRRPHRGADTGARLRCQRRLLGDEEVLEQRAARLGLHRVGWTAGGDRRCTT